MWNGSRLCTISEPAVDAEGIRFPTQRTSGGGRRFGGGHLQAMPFFCFDKVSLLVDADVREPVCVPQFLDSALSATMEGQQHIIVLVARKKDVASSLANDCFARCKHDRTVAV